MKNTFRLIAFALILAYIGWQKVEQDRAQNVPPAQSAPASQGAPPATTANGDDAIAQDFQQHLSNVRVQGSGTVAKLLRDYSQGLKHQKFLLKLGSGQTVLVAHDVGIAPEVEDLKEGDTVEFSGEYVWDERGGIVHWTHHDPEGRHAAGWLKHNGKTYQ